MQVFLLIASTSLAMGVVQSEICDTGSWGEHCEKRCDIHCSCYGCDKTTGICRSCSMGYWGSHCNRLCPLVCRKRCDFNRYYDCSFSTECGPSCRQNDGSCQYACVDGFWGEFCNKSCDLVFPNCADCDGKGARCYNCKPGFWNTTCNSRCLTNCAECSKSNGKCSRCMPEYWGEGCENRCTVQHCQYCNQTGSCEQCNRGFWGETCGKTCVGRQCGFCHRTSGICEWCENGYWGQDCENKCGEGCADNRCEKITGLCENCKRNYWGDTCNITHMLVTEKSSEVKHEDVKHAEDQISVADYFGISVGTSVLVIVVFLLVSSLIIFLCRSRTVDDIKGNRLTKMISRISAPKRRMRNEALSATLSNATDGIETPDRRGRNISGTSNPAADIDSAVRDAVAVQDIIIEGSSSHEQHTPSFYEHLRHGDSSDKDYDDMRHSVYENSPSEP